MTLHELDRRAVLEWLVAVAAVGPSTLFAQQSAPPSTGLPGADLAAVKDLGKKYLADYADDRAGVDQMEQRLADSDLTDEPLVEQLRAEMHDDFSAQQTADLYGWIVSRTEARVFAAIGRIVE